MSEINFDDIEKNFNNAILNNNRDKRAKNNKEKKPKMKKIKNKRRKVLKEKNQYNENKIVLFSIILSVLLIFLFLTLITRKNDNNVEKINKKLIDEVKYIQEDAKKELVKSNGEDEIEIKKNNEKMLDKNNEFELISEDTEINLKVKKTTELSTYYAIQVAASKNLKSIESKIKELLKNGEKAYYIKEGINQYMYKIIIDKKFKTRIEANNYAEMLKNKKMITEDFWVRYFNKK